MCGCVIHVCENVVWYDWLKGVGVLTCMINPEPRDIWSLPYVQIMAPACHNSDMLFGSVGPQYELLVVWDTGVREWLKYQVSQD